MSAHPILGPFARFVEPFARYDGPPPRALGRFFYWCLKGSEKALAFGAVIAVIAGTVEVFAAMLLGKVIDRATAAGPAHLFDTQGWFLIGVVVFLIVLRPIIFGLSATVQTIVVGPSVTVLILSRLHRWTLGQAVTFFDNDFAGRIAQKQMQASRALTEVTVDTLNTVVFALASMVATALLVYAIDWRISVLLIVWLAGYLRYISWYIPRIREKAEARASARAQVTGVVVDTVTNIRTVKLFAHDEHEDRAAIDSMATYRDRSLDFAYVATTFRSWLMVIAGLVPVTMIGATLWFWVHGTATTGDIAAAGTVSLRIAQMTGWVSFTLMNIYSNVGVVEDAMNTLTPMHTLTDKPGAVENTGPARIVFDHVSFDYGRLGDEKHKERAAALHDVSLTIEEGEKVGLVGGSGAGKSTLVALLLRLYDVEKGSVTVGDQDVRDVTQESLRRRIGMVTQETAMFNRSARDNILYGRPDASEDELLEAAEMAEAHDFIEELEDFKGRTGYGAHLGERGVKLSGGQRQRIALARAILKDAPILVLDEATSALDSEVEAQIQEALDDVMRGKTVLAIAHRLSTIAQMDRIVVLDQGRIVEQGTHHELIALGGHYAGFWNRQSGGFLGMVDAAE